MIRFEADELTIMKKDKVRLTGMHEDLSLLQDHSLPQASKVCPSTFVLIIPS